MITWQDIQNEVAQASVDHGGAGLDVVRRASYQALAKITGRPLLVYASAFQNPIKAANFSPLMGIDLTDKDGFQEIINGIESKKVDILLHSPGGFAEATESIVGILRHNFREVRFIVTGTAKSAATMLAMSGNSILMSTAGELGPIDPQINLGNIFTPAGSLKEEFEKAAQEIAENPERLPVWLPILEKYTPALLIQCDNFIQLASDLVTKWLKTYMLKGTADSKAVAEKIAKYLANEKNTLSHARRIDAKELKKLGVKVEEVENQKSDFQDALRKVHPTVMMTLDNTDAIKIYENSNGRALIRQISMAPIFQPPPQLPQNP